MQPFRTIIKLLMGLLRIGGEPKTIFLVRHPDEQNYRWESTPFGMRAARALVKGKKIQRLQVVESWQGDLHNVLSSLKTSPDGIGIEWLEQIPDNMIWG